MAPTADEFYAKHPPQIHAIAMRARQLIFSVMPGAVEQVNLGNDESWDTHEAAFRNLKDFLLPPTDRAVSGKNSQGKVRVGSPRPGYPWRISTGAPGRRTRRMSRAAASRSGMWWIMRDIHAPSAD